MLTRLSVFGALPYAKVLPFAPTSSPADDPLQIKNIEGLGPVKANISSAPFGDRNGEYFVGSSVGSRNIVITLGLNPDWATQTMASLRTEAYAYFMPQQAVELQFEGSHIPTVRIMGYVESMDPNLFSQDPELQISIICLQPEFVAVEATSIIGAMTANGGSLVEIDYLGNIDTGFVVRMSNTAGRLPAAVYTLAPYSLTVDTTTIVAGSYVDVSTVPGDKYITKDSGQDLLWATNLGSGWPKLRPGPNQFGVWVNPSFGTGKWELRYRDRFGGI